MCLGSGGVEDINHALTGERITFAVCVVSVETREVEVDRRGPMMMSEPATEERAQAREDEDNFSGLCRICGGTVPRASDPGSCTPSLCSERCLARALVAYWAALGVEATVTLRDGYARLEGLRPALRVA